MRRCLGCNILIASGSRCALCREAYRPSAARTQLPQLAKERDGYRCRQCGGTDRLQAHHITPISMGGTHDLGNLITLCHGCHQARHRGNYVGVA